MQYSVFWNKCRSIAWLLFFIRKSNAFLENRGCSTPWERNPLSTHFRQWLWHSLKKGLVRVCDSFLHKEWTLWLKRMQNYKDALLWSRTPGFHQHFWKKQIMVVVYAQHAIHSICQAFLQMSTTPSTLCLALNIELFSMRLAAVQSFKGAQHLFERNMKLFSRRLIATQSFFEELKESMEGGQQCFRMESFNTNVIQKNWEGGWASSKDLLHPSTYCILLKEILLATSGNTLYSMQLFWRSEVFPYKLSYEDNEGKAELH